MIEGNFIVIEGVDGAGTTTHSRRLEAALQVRGLPVHVTREPSDGPVGVLLRQAITGRVVVPGPSGPRPPSWTTMALLFAADRIDHVESEIKPNLMGGVTVISDRYDHSSVAYQSLVGGGAAETIEWVLAINRHARRPDLVIVLDLPADVACARRERRSIGEEIYDDSELQERLVRFYREIDQYFPEDKVVHVDANRPIEEVEADIQKHVEALRGEG